jgi:hypothetical protein
MFCFGYIRRAACWLASMSTLVLSNQNRKTCEEIIIFVFVPTTGVQSIISTRSDHRIPSSTTQIYDGFVSSKISSMSRRYFAPSSSSSSSDYCRNQDQSKRASQVRNTHNTMYLMGRMPHSFLYFSDSVLIPGPSSVHTFLYFSDSILTQGPSSLHT